MLRQFGRERLASQLNDLQGSDHPPGIAWKDARCGHRVGSTQPLMESLGALRRELVLQTRSYRRIGTGEIEVVNDGSDIQCRPANHNRYDIAGDAFCNRQPCELLELRHCRVFCDVEQVDHVMTDLCALGL